MSCRCVEHKGFKTKCVDDAAQIVTLGTITPTGSYYVFIENQVGRTISQYRDLTSGNVTIDISDDFFRDGIYKLQMENKAPITIDGEDTNCIYLTLLSVDNPNVSDGDWDSQTSTAL